MVTFWRRSHDPIREDSYAVSWKYDVEFLVCTGGLFVSIAIVFAETGLLVEFLWVMTRALTGYFLGTMIQNIQERIPVVIAIVIFLSLAPAIVKIASEELKGVRRRRGGAL